MRLADFIADNTELILAEWVTFAHTISAKLNVVQLRDHAKGMLTAMVADLREPQSPREQAIKARGDSPRRSSADTAAETHGGERDSRGFSISEVVSEFRALRASVLRLWIKACPHPTEADMEDATRFHEAIDQALAESTDRFEQQHTAAQELFLAMLGQDLRTPLGAVLIASHFLLTSEDTPDTQRPVAARIEQHATSIDKLIKDLLVLTQVKLGAGVSIVPTDVNVETKLSAAVAETMLGNPNATIGVTIAGNLRGRWDRSRIHQVFLNLLSGAVQHGAGFPVTVTAYEEAEQVVVTVNNRGAMIPASVLPDLFIPFYRPQAAGADPWAGRNFGLGLYIAEHIVVAHGGTLRVESSEEAGTTFTVRLPRALASA